MPVMRVAAPLRSQATEQLRRLIISQDYPPGSRLIERDLCARLEVSRTIVREALRQLEAEGLVRNIPNKGPIVAILTEGEAAEIYEIRAVLEGLAGRKFVENTSDAQRKRLCQKFTRLEQAFERDDAKAVLRLSAEFYEIIFEGAGSKVLLELLTRLQSRIAMLRSMTLDSRDRMPQTRQEIQAIWEAITRGDPQAAAAACIDHVESAARVAQHLLSSSPSEEAD